MVAVNSTVGTAVAVAVLVGDGFNAGVSVAMLQLQMRGLRKGWGFVWREPVYGWLLLLKQLGCPL